MKKFLFGILFSLLWSSAFIAGKYTILYLPPIDVLVIRFLLAAVFIAILCRLWRKSQPLHSHHKQSLWMHGAVLGILNYALYLGLSYTGLQTVSPEIVVLIVSTMPFITTLGASIISKEWSILQWIAIAIGFGGVWLVLSSRLPNGQWWSEDILWVILSMLALAAGTLYFRFFAEKQDMIKLTGIQNFIGGLVLLPFISPSNWAQAWQEPVFIVGLWYQILFISLAAMLMWMQLIRWYGPSDASVFHLLNPIFATWLAWLFFSITLGWRDVIGTILVVLGLGVVYWHKKSQITASIR